MNKQKIVLIGAGSLTFGLGSVGSILDSEVLRGATICLHDINEETLEVVNQTCQNALQEKGGDFIIESTTDRKKALKDATFIISS
ncbi:MAG: family 4 glycosyl hydrolase, partial [Promethearchaeota archaeon]